jgi:hypothetical protein
MYVLMAIAPRTAPMAERTMMAGRYPSCELGVGVGGVFGESGVTCGDSFVCSPGSFDVVRRLVPFISTGSYSVTLYGDSTPFTSSNTLPRDEDVSFRTSASCPFSLRTGFCLFPRSNRR